MGKSLNNWQANLLSPRAATLREEDDNARIPVTSVDLSTRRVDVYLDSRAQGSPLEDVGLHLTFADDSESKFASIR